ncbi:MAG: tetracycline resistance MFS efflux pump, partial [Brevundimonas sp.]|nr:tetracycline resistance MFS efflux pump [Brevundimonas sp.]
MSILHPKKRRAAIAFIFVTAVLDILAMGLVIPVLPALIEEFAGSGASAGIWN